MLGVASVLGGFSISDSSGGAPTSLREDRRHRPAERPARRRVVNDGRADGAPEGEPRPADGRRRRRRGDRREGGPRRRRRASRARARALPLRRPGAAGQRHRRRLPGPRTATRSSEGRGFSPDDIDTARAGRAPRGRGGRRSSSPTGDAVGQTIRVGDMPVVVVGVLKERVFRWRDGAAQRLRVAQPDHRRPRTLVARRMQGDRYHRVDRVTFKIPSWT